MARDRLSVLVIAMESALLDNRHQVRGTACLSCLVLSCASRTTCSTVAGQPLHTWSHCIASLGVQHQGRPASWGWHKKHHGTLPQHVACGPVGARSGLLLSLFVTSTKAWGTEQCQGVLARC